VPRTGHPQGVPIININPKVGRKKDSMLDPRRYMLPSYGVFAG